MTTTELIKILKDNECGGFSHKPREISLTINGKYMPNPQITLSSTGDGICGAEIDLDVDGDFMGEQEPCEDCISRTEAVNALRQSLYNYEDKTEKQFLDSNDLDVSEWIVHRIFVQNMNDADVKAINDLQPVQQEQKAGHWTRELIRNEYGGCIGAKMICSECGQDNGYDKRMKFCPNCGAKMEE